MRHLTTEQLVDLAEGFETASAAQHVRLCVACQRQITELRGAMSAVAEVETPEPSPLFWEHFSARVRDAVVSDRDLGAARHGGVYTAGAQVANWLGMRGAAVCASLMVVAVVAFSFGGNRPSPTPTQFEPASVALEAPNDTAPSADDPSLSLVADLAADLDWESAREAGLTTHIGVDDDALSQLTSGERGELHRLLQGELSPSRRGA